MKESKFKHCDGCIIDPVCKVACEKFMKTLKEYYNDVGKNNLNFLELPIVRQERNINAIMRIIRIEMSYHVLNNKYKIPKERKNKQCQNY